MKKTLTLLMALLVLTTTALAVDPFPAKNTYPGFADVVDSADNWYYAAVKLCVETGLMSGTDQGFQPNGILTVGEVATIAARMSESLTGEAIVHVSPKPGETLPWYFSHVAYLESQGVSVPADREAKATRAQFAALLAAVLPQTQLAAINSIAALPDSDDAAALRLYNAGILTGTDPYGTFNGGGTLSRAEAAVMVARVADASTRKQFTLTEKPKAETPTEDTSIVSKVLGIPGSTTIITVDGTPVSAEAFCATLVSAVFYQDSYQYQNYGARLDWNYDYGVGDLGAYFKQTALNAVVTQVIEQNVATQYGVKAEALPALLFPSGSAAQLDTYIAEKGLLRAKHILLPTADLDTGTPLPQAEQEAALNLANSICILLQDDVDNALFDALMQEYSQDTGLATSPDGYLFSPGQMVEEFESGTKALAIGQVSQPVKSSFGYHVILRLDPKGDSTLAAQYQEDCYQKQLTEWIQAADVRGSELYTSLSGKDYYLKALPYYATGD